MLVEQCLRLLLSAAQRSKWGVLLLIFGVLGILFLLVFGMASFIGNLILLTQAAPVIHFLANGMGILVLAIASIISVLFGVAILLFLKPQAPQSYPASTDPSQSPELERLRSEKERLRCDLEASAEHANQLQDQIKQRTAERDEARVQKQETDRQLGERNKRIRDLNNAKTRLEVEAQEHRDEKSQLEATLKQERILRQREGCVTELTKLIAEGESLAHDAEPTEHMEYDWVERVRKLLQMAWCDYETFDSVVSHTLSPVWGPHSSRDNESKPSVKQLHVSSLKRLAEDFEQNPTRKVDANFDVETYRSWLEQRR